MPVVVLLLLLLLLLLLKSSKCAYENDGVLRVLDASSWNFWAFVGGG